VVALLTSMAAPGATPLPVPPAMAWPVVPPIAEFSDYSAPEKVLRAFILAMYEWEKRAPELAKEHARGSTTARTELLREMQAVFDLYCTPIERLYGRNGAFMTPPEYDPAESLLAIEKVNPRTARLITRDKDGQKEYLYVLLKKKGRWLVDNKKYRFAGEDWNKWNL
jgi:hypothetical protein